MSPSTEPAGHGPIERASAPRGRSAASPERWQAIDRVVQAALARPPEQRSAFVEAACDGDPALRGEVDSLLAAAVAPADTLDMLGELAVGPGLRGTGMVDGAGSDAASLDGLDVVARLTAALAGRYDIERELGRGGMATVYLARDLRHKRRVALKVLDTRPGTLLGATRFRREIETAARLNHPHILPLFDSGEAADRLYYVMPYVAGESLRDRIRRVGPMPVKDVLRIVREVADALDHAHRRGVVHRDVKPANVLLDEEGRALVADFGIARAVHAASSIASRAVGEGDDGPESLTFTGAVVGTPGYMSPEQWRGDGEVDARTDVYALGCVVREMLVGVPVSTGDDRRLPTAIRRAVRRATADRAADRYASAGAFAAALDAAARRIDGRRLLRVGVPSVGLASIAAVGWWAWGEPGVRSPATTRARSLAVLPCTTRAADSMHAYLTEGVTQDLIAEASRSRAFDKVIAYSSTSRYRNAAKPPAQVGAELGADVLLYCHYEQMAAHERLRAEAVRAADGALLWTDASERDANVPASGVRLPGRLVASLVGAVDGGVRGREAPTDPIGSTDDLRALNLYKEGGFYLGQLREDAVQRSIHLFRQALARDSTFALPYVGLANAYFLLGGGVGRMHEREALPLMKELAERALALDDRIAEAHLLLGIYEGQFAWNWVEAERRFRRAIALDPNAAGAHEMFGWALANLGRYEEAFAMSDRATELNPVDPVVWADAGGTRILAGRYAEAIPLIEKGLALGPNVPPVVHFMLGAAYTELGDSARALPRLRMADSLAGHVPSFRSHLGYGYAVAGDTAAARAILRDLKSTDARAGHAKAAAGIATVHAGLGEPDSAFAWFEVAYAEHLTTLATYLTTPAGRRLSGDPRYVPLLRRVGLPVPPFAVARR